MLVKDRQIALMKDETLTGHDTELVHKLYALASDREYRNAQGTKPVQPYLNAIAAIDSLDALMEYLRSGENVMRILPINVNVDADPLDPDMRVNATLAQFDDFLNFYGIGEGDGMYIAPEDRGLVW